MEEILINLGVSALLVSIKNPAKRISMRKIFLKVFNAIKSAYPNDAEFGTDV